MFRYFTILITIMAAVSCGVGKTETVIKGINDGDIIFQETVSSQATAITLVTKSRYTHMGIIRKSKGKFFVFEAVSPVRITPLNKFIARGKGSHYIIKRLKNASNVLTPEVLKKMEKEGNGFIGKKYDTLFQWSDERIYCSELVWKIYKRGTGIEIGELQTFSDFDLSHPKVRELIKKRYGRNKFKPDEKVISPVQMFNSPLLITVEERG